MSAEAALFSLLIADPGLSALIGTRLYPDILPKNRLIPASATPGSRRRALSSGSCPRRVARQPELARAFSSTASLRAASARKQWLMHYARP